MNPEYDPGMCDPSHLGVVLFYALMAAMVVAFVVDWVRRVLR